MSEINIGDAAPDFDLPTDDGGHARLSDFRGRHLVLYFYPKDDTSGCTAEAIAFTAREKEFDAAGATVLGISPDSCASHEKFKKKHALSVRLAADEDKDVVKRYGVWVKKTNYGREYMGVERATFLIGTEGRVVRIWRKVSVTGHVDAVLDAVRDAVGC